MMLPAPEALRQVSPTRLPAPAPNRASKARRTALDYTCLPAACSNIGSSTVPA